LISVVFRKDRAAPPRVERHVDQEDHPLPEF
jgi:hypothetical protein